MRPKKPWLFVLGTRPEAIKLAPVLREFQRREIVFGVVWTGQHDALFAQTGFLEEFAPDITPLGLAGTNDPLHYVALAQDGLTANLAPERFRGVIVQGDTASALSGGRWARLAGIPLAHVEAGLRTWDVNDPWPEEQFRVELDAISSYHFAPTVMAATYCPMGTVWCTGNTGVDALRWLGVKHVPPSERWKRIVVTLHRRESFGAPLAAIAGGIAQVARRRGLDWGFRWPMHPNPEVARSLADVDLPDNVFIEEPLAYAHLPGRLASSRAVLTDSGGIIEEAATLGIPCVIARDKTERMEAVGEGRAILAGRTSEGVATALEKALTPGALETSPGQTFGDGHASEHITDVLEDV